MTWTHPSNSITSYPTACCSVRAILWIWSVPLVSVLCAWDGVKRPALLLKWPQLQWQNYLAPNLEWNDFNYTWRQNVTIVTNTFGPWGIWMRFCNCVISIYIWLVSSDLLITVTSQWAPWLLKPPASGLFAQSFVQAHIKEKLRVTDLWERNPPVTGGFHS